MIGREQWQLVHYEWNEDTGVARACYRHRRTGEVLETTLDQPRYRRNVDGGAL